MSACIWGSKHLGNILRAALLVPVLLGGIAGFLPTYGQISQGDGDLRVMTYNIYQGTNHTEAVSAKTQEEFLRAVGQTITQVRATNPPQRMQAVAQQIVAANPALVSLQEVNTWSTGPFNANGTCGPMTIEFDMLRDLLDALAAQHVFYEVVVQAQQFVVPPTPGFFPPSICVQEANRVVILARTDLDTSKFQVMGAQSGQFQNFFVYQTAVGPFPDRRAWVAVDAAFNGKSFRLIGSHLDPTDPNIHRLQAAELREGPANTPVPIIIGMDANAQAAPSPQNPTYVDFITAGWQDAWTKTNRNAPGLTCCQSQLVNNPVSQLFQRIDLILTHGRIVPQNIALFGITEESKTADGLWPSDHVGVAAQLLVQ